MANLSPIHVHVKDNTPVHLHVKKSKEPRHENRQLAGSRSNRATAKARSKALNGPWIPAPGKTSTRDRKAYKWDTMQSQLEIRNHDEELHMDDLEDDERVKTHIKNYEQKIEDLMNQVGSLKNEVELQKVEKELQEKSQALQASKESLHQQRQEMEAVTRDFEATERENLRLLRSMELSANRSDRRLLKALIEVEMQGQSVAQQINVVRGLLHNIDQQPNPADLASMAKERESLMQKFTTFELANRDLRTLLQDEQEANMEIQRLIEQRDTLIRKMSEADNELSRFKKDAFENKTSVEQVLDQLEEEKKHSHTLTELNKSIDATRAHLQRELRAKEMENNRLHVQLTNMERDTNAVKREAEDEINAARTARETITSEKEALKKATRAQKQRAEKAEVEKKEVELKLSDHERMLAEAKEDVETWKARYHRAMDDRSRSDTQCKTMQSKLDEADQNRHRSAKEARDREADLTQQLHKLTSENTSNRLDAERLRGELANVNEKLRKLDDEVTIRRKEGQQWETLTSDLRASIAKHKNEAEEALLTAERVERDARRVRTEGSEEIEKVRKQMLERMRDLHPLPDLLKETEMKLQDCQEQILVYERRSKEQSKVIAELTGKLDDQTEQSSTLKQKLSAMSDENRALEARMEIFRTKLDDRDNVMRDSAIDRMNKDEDIQSLQLKLQERQHEISSLQRQLDSALIDVRKAGDLERDNAAARERVAQSRILDLETQITRLKTDILHYKKAKEDTERKTQSQLQDMNDRLQQSESTNRSMRNYVSFLKSSYTSVFGDTSSPPRGAPSSPL